MHPRDHGKGCKSELRSKPPDPPTRDHGILDCNDITNVLHHVCTPNLHQKNIKVLRSLCGHHQSSTFKKHQRITSDILLFSWHTVM